MFRGSGAAAKKKMFEVLSDRQWHSFGKLLAAAGPLVRPDEAIKRYRFSIRRPKGKKEPRTQIQQLGAGSKYVLLTILFHMKKHGWIEANYDNHRAMLSSYRLTDRWVG